MSRICPRQALLCDEAPNPKAAIEDIDHTRRPGTVKGADTTSR
jgi:hypothetical protein